MQWLKQNKKNTFFALIFSVTILSVVFPLFHEGFFVTDDGEWMIIRLSAFYQALADGQFPVRYLGRLNHEYGYPVPTFLYPGFLYIGSFIHLLKIDFVDIVKIILGYSIFGSFVFTFLWLRNFFEKFSSFIGALSIILAPYFLFDIYKRGSVGEVLAISILPFIFWQIEKKSLFWISIGIGFLILSHNSLAAIFMVMIGIYMGLDIYTQKVSRVQLVFKYFLSIILGLGIAAFFWLPVLLELPLTKFSETVISNPFEYFAGIRLIGYSTVLILAVSIYFYITQKIHTDNYRLTVLFLIFGLLSVFLTSSYSGFIWSILPVSFIQFPFRLLSVSIISTAFLTAHAVAVLRGMNRFIFIAAIVILQFSSAYNQLSSIDYIDKEEGFYVTNNATTTVHDEYLPVWVRSKPVERFDNKVEIIGNGNVRDLVYNNSRINFSVDLESDSTVQVNTIFWPGWTVDINGTKSEISYNNPQGVMQFDLSGGTHNFNMRFGENYNRLMADVISIFSLFGLILFTSKKVLWKR